MARTRLKTASITSFLVKKPRSATPAPTTTSPIPVPEPTTIANKCTQSGVEWCSRNGVSSNAADCSVADFVRADPADQPPNLFRIKQLTDRPELLRQVLRAYGNQGPFQPQQNAYKSRMFGDRSRSFQRGWFDRYPWLEYSPKADAAFCFCCYLSREIMTLEDDMSVFTQPDTGYGNWKKALTSSGFAKHAGERCSKHKTAETALTNLLQTDHDIGLALNRQSLTERQANCDRIKTILDICILLARQGLAFRGHDETFLQENSKNKGNFLELVQFTAQRDSIFSGQMDAAGYNAKYTSPAVQQQLVQCAAGVVRQHILETELGDGYFSLLVDEASCEAKTEQMSIVIRFVHRATGRILERFLGTVNLKDTSAATLFASLETQLTKWGLNLSRCRGQGYDGAANMSGDYNGLQQRVRDVCPNAHFIHCFAHRLNLVLVAVAKNTVSVVECLDTVPLIHTTCSASCKRKDQLLHSARNEKEQLLRDGYLETGKGLNQPLTTESLSKTRWNCRVRALLRIKWLWFPIANVLEEIAATAVKAEKKAEASGILERMWSFNFVFHVETLIVVLEKANSLSMYLQKKDMDIVTAARLVEQVTTELIEMRDNCSGDQDSSSFNAVWERAETFCHSICEDDESIVPCRSATWKRRGARSRGKGRANVPGADRDQFSSRKTQEEHYRDDIYRKIVNDVLTELQTRFSDGMLRLMELCGGLSPKSTFRRWNPDEIARIATDFYTDDFENQTSNLRSEEKRFGELGKKDSRFSDLKTTEDLSIAMIAHDMNSIFPSLFRLVSLVCVLPVSTASTERSFSTMKRTKTRLRASLGHAFLSNLLLLALERDLSATIDKDAVLDKFRKMAERRLKF